MSLLNLMITLFDHPEKLDRQSLLDGIHCDLKSTHAVQRFDDESYI